MTDGELVSKTGDNILRHGREAWLRLKADQTWSDWLAVGEALQYGREMVTARVGRSDGGAFNRAFSGWLAENGFADIDQATRSHLKTCSENLAEITRWRSTLTLSERNKLNHPHSVVRRWKAATTIPDPEAPKKPSLVSTLKERNAELETENARLERSAGGGSHFDLDHDTPRDIARVIVGAGLSKAKRLMQELAKAIKAEEERLSKAT